MKLLLGDSQGALDADPRKRFPTTCALEAALRQVPESKGPPARKVPWIAFLAISVAAAAISLVLANRRWIDGRGAAKSDARGTLAEGSVAGSESYSLAKLTAGAELVSCSDGSTVYFDEQVFLPMDLAGDVHVYAVYIDPELKPFRLVPDPKGRADLDNPIPAGTRFLPPPEGDEEAKLSGWVFAHIEGGAQIWVLTSRESVPGLARALGRLPGASGTADELGASESGVKIAESVAKIDAWTLALSKIDEGTRRGQISFGPHLDVDLDRSLHLVQMTFRELARHPGRTFSAVTFQQRTLTKE